MAEEQKFGWNTVDCTQLLEENTGWPVARIAIYLLPTPMKKKCRRKLSTASAQRIASRAAQASCQRALEFGVKATLVFSLKISTVLTYHGLLHGYRFFVGIQYSDFVEFVKK